MAENSEKKEAAFRLIKIGGLLSFIPLILIAGPVGGYFIGDILEKRFGLPGYTTPICITIGFLVSAKETARIIKLTSKEANKLG